jgi:hypothetical protein
VLDRAPSHPNPPVSCVVPRHPDPVALHCLAATPPPTPTGRGRYQLLRHSPPRPSPPSLSPAPLHCLLAAPLLKREPRRRRPSFSPLHRDFPSPLRHRAATTSLASASSHRIAPQLTGALSSPTPTTASAPTPPPHVEPPLG